MRGVFMDVTQAFLRGRYNDFVTSWTAPFLWEVQRFSYVCRVSMRNHRRGHVYWSICILCCNSFVKCIPHVCARCLNVSFTVVRLLLERVAALHLRQALHFEVILRRIFWLEQNSGVVAVLSGIP